MTAHPYPATVLVIDLRRFGGLTNPEQIVARRQLYDLLSAAFAASDLDWELCSHEDRGDGVLVIVPVEVPKAVLLDSVLTELATRVEDAPRLASGWSMSLRVAVHTGEVHRDENGFVGSDINHAFRLLDSDVLREALSATDRRCAVLVSDVLYQGIVRHGYGRIEPAAFHRAVVHTKEMTTAAWLFVSGDEATARTVANRHRAEPVTSVSGVRVGGAMSMENSNLALGDQHVGDVVGIQNATFLQQVRTYSARHPRLAVLVAVLVLAFLGAGGYAIYVAVGGDPAETVDTSAGGDLTEPLVADPSTTTDAPAPNSASPGLRDPGILVGSWQSSDDVAKTFSGNGGPCEGFFYSNGQALDIGGPMTCVVSSRPDGDGRFTMRVTQQPNRASYKVLLESADQVAVYGMDGALLYRLNRF
ncbi:hypothetical protein [Actinophytocola sp.]|uniref:hypothetical protein n=1 Tax=Actinophytocola sp. TaxID=1872138 RepID=UPI003899D94A